MKFMMIVKHSEKQGPPPKSLMDAISKLAEDAVKSGTMLGNGGLGPTAQGARVRVSGGKISVIDGPFTEAKEVVGRFAQFELKSKEEAVESAVRGYKEINLRAARLLDPGGILATFSCSHHISPGFFETICRDAIGDARVPMRVLQSLTQSADHPVRLAVPEARYLTGLLLERV